MTEPTPRTEAVNLVGECRMVGGHTHAFNGPHRFNEAQARAEGLDVEVLARALQAKRGGRMSDNRGWAKDIAARYRAILTGETE